MRVTSMVPPAAQLMAPQDPPQYGYEWPTRPAASTIVLLQRELPGHFSKTPHIHAGRPQKRLIWPMARMMAARANSQKDRMRRWPERNPPPVSSRWSPQSQPTTPKLITLEMRRIIKLAGLGRRNYSGGASDSSCLAYTRRSALVNRPTGSSSRTSHFSPSLAMTVTIDP